MDAAASWQAFACDGELFSVISITNNWCSCPPSIRQEKRTMEPFVTMGLVLKETRYREADRILTILTPKLGVITAMAANSLRLKSKLFSACGLFCYSEFTLVPRTQYVYRAGSRCAEHLPWHFLLH